MFIVVLCPSVTILLTCLLVFVISNDFRFSFFIFVNIYTCYGMIGCVALVSVKTCADALLGIIVCVPFPDSHLFQIRVRLLEPCDLPHSLTLRKCKNAGAIFLVGGGRGGGWVGVITY